MQKSMDFRFLKKILTDTEIEQLHRCDDPDAALWSLWACKEAAYKVLKKQTSDAAFVPRRWSVHFGSLSPAVERPDTTLYEARHEDQKPTEFTTGDVLISENKSIPFLLFSSGAYVHCLAADRLDVLDKANWRIDALPEGDQQGNDPSAFARSCLTRALSAFFGYDPCQIKIFRAQENDGELQPPVVYRDGIKADIDVSLSHDGQFVAYAFLP